MSNWALIHENKVIQIGERFEVAPQLFWVDLGEHEDVIVGDCFCQSDNTFKKTRELMELEQLKALTKNELESVYKKSKWIALKNDNLEFERTLYSKDAIDMIDSMLKGDTTKVLYSNNLYKSIELSDEVMEDIRKKIVVFRQCMFSLKTFYIKKIEEAEFCVDLNLLSFDFPKAEFYVPA